MEEILECISRVGFSFVVIVYSPFAETCISRVLFRLTFIDFARGVTDVYIEVNSTEVSAVTTCEVVCSEPTAVIFLSAAQMTVQFVV